MLASIMAIPTMLANGDTVRVNYPPPKGGELLVLPSTPSLA